jgi:hypothetical protein
MPSSASPLALYLCILRATFVATLECVKSSLKPLYNSMDELAMAWHQHLAIETTHRADLFAAVVSKFVRCCPMPLLVMLTCEAVDI